MSDSAETSERSGAQRGGPEWLDRMEQVDRHVASTAKKIVRDLQDLVSAAESEAAGHLLAATARLDGAANQSGILTALLEEGRRFASRTAFFLTRPGEVRGWAGRGFPAVQRAHLDYAEGSVWARLATQAGVIGLTAEESAAVCRSLDADAGGPGVLIPFVLRGQLGGALYADRLEAEGALGIASLQLLTHVAAQTVETMAVRGGGRSPALRYGPVTAAEQGSMPLWQPPQDEAPDSAHPTSAVPVTAVAAAAAALADAVARAEEVEPEKAEAAPEPTPEESAAAAAEAEEIEFEMVSAGEVDEDLRAAEDIEDELEPEPELEDTSDLWAAEEEAEEEEDDTYVGPAPIDEPSLDEPSAVTLPDVGQETVRLDVAALQNKTPPAEPPAYEASARQMWAPVPKADELELEPDEEPPAYEIEPEPAEPVTAKVAAPDFTEDATIVSDRSDLLSPRAESPMAGGFVPPAAEVSPVEATPPPSSGFSAPAVPKVEATGSSQVVPPTDIQGPGSAFASASTRAIPEGEEALHEEARRLARLLVSEIKLYNEEIIEEGRRSGNIYDRLKDDIDRSRQMYEERIDPRLMGSGNDYFRQELVQRLAGGNERLLGY